MVIDRTLRWEKVPSGLQGIIKEKYKKRLKPTRKSVCARGDEYLSALQVPEHY
jgi:hypothetical protein